MIENLNFADFLAGAWKHYAFTPFKNGVEISWLHKKEDGAGVALLRYAAGASVPMHSHPDFETILVLEGSQTDEAGTYEKGDIVVNPSGSTHAVRSEIGCVVLIIWTKPVSFIDPV